MPFWRKGNRPARLPGSRRSRIGRTPHFGQRALWALGLLTMIATAETVAHPFRGEARQKPTPKTTATKKANETPTPIAVYAATFQPSPGGGRARGPWAPKAM